MRTRRHDYDSPLDSVEESEGEGDDSSDLPVVLDDQPSVPCPPRLSDCLGTWRINYFDDMDDRGGGSMVVQDRYSGRAEGIAFADWKKRFKSWQKTQRQCNPVFKNWWTFKQLPSHLEHEALQSYDSWYEEHKDQLLVVELYWTQRVELITALKERAAISDAREEVVTEVDPDDDEEASTVRVLRRGRAARPAGSSTTTGSSLSRLSQATREAVASLGDPPPFESLKEFFDYLKVEYGGIRWDRIRHIQDFQREKGDTARIMYARLARFAKKTGNAFTECQLVALYMAKQDKHNQ